MKDHSNKLVYVLLGVVLFSAFKTPTVPTQVQEPQINQDRLITVTGSADMLVPPDEITVEISYREYWNNYKLKKKEEIKNIEDKIINAITEAGVEKEKIVVNSDWAWRHNWNYWHYWYNYYNQLHQKNLTVKVTSPAQLDEIISNIKDRSIKKEGIVSIMLNGSSNKDIQEYRKMVKERAIQAAEEKADYLLSAVNQKRGVVVSVTELADPQTTSTTRHNYYDYWGRGWPYYGGYGYSSVTSSPNAMISNSSVNMPVGGVSRGSGGSGNDDLGMKPIRLRYEIQVVFAIQ